MADGPKRYDILLVSQNRTYNVVEQGLKSVLNYLSAANIVRVNDESIAKEWTEVYGRPGATAHEGFVRSGTFASDEAVYLEMVVRAGKRPTKLAYGPTPEQGDVAHFFIEFRGALFNDLSPKLKNRLKDLLMTRFDLYTRDHVELPPHAVVDEPPDEVKYAKKDGTPPRVGTAVEEY